MSASLQRVTLWTNTGPLDVNDATRADTREVGHCLPGRSLRRALAQAAQHAMIPRLNGTA
jgi:hypothetical protein